MVGDAFLRASAEGEEVPEVSGGAGATRLPSDFSLLGLGDGVFFLVGFELAVGFLVGFEVPDGFRVGFWVGFEGAGFFVEVPTGGGWVGFGWDGGFPALDLVGLGGVDGFLGGFLDGGAGVPLGLPGLKAGRAPPMTGRAVQSDPSPSTARPSTVRDMQTGSGSARAARAACAVETAASELRR
ncbi:hypothetical protein [Planobispora longispora]|uniref:hypothetical protein n=1 Tax=Planobispora longispora TaxID=28887 RepID=UPI001940E49F|nr:hypothetical protein [Planobispora longispora]BFE84844.1 hypothetical protein GCM10020093_074450 [Planobispora longispora]